MDAELDKVRMIAPLAVLLLIVGILVATLAPTGINQLAESNISSEAGDGANELWDLMPLLFVIIFVVAFVAVVLAMFRT